MGGQSDTAHRSSEVRTRKEPLELTVIRSLISAGHRHMRRGIKASCSELKCNESIVTFARPVC